MSRAIDWILDHPYWLLVLLVAAVFACAKCDHDAWVRYSTEHHCKDTGETRKSTRWQCMHIGDNSCGYMMPIEETDHLYACDGGEKVWR